jgi:energy-coupling factor transport system ATP-binding protein
MEIIFQEVSFKDRLSNIDLNIETGKIIGIVGKSGSGKTTIAELMDVLERPTKGKILIDKYEILNDNKIKNINDIRFNVGLVFQNTEEQIFNTNVLDEIAFGMKYFNYKTDKIEQRVKDSIKMVGLKEEYLNKNPFHLSAGEMKKVAIASVLAFNPEVLVLDEPMESLDYQSKMNLIKIIRNLKNRYNKTVVILSQNTDFLHKIVDYVYIINDGKIVLEGKKYDVFKQEDKLSEYKVRVPKVIEFSNLVYKKKNIKMGYRDEINDLIKDIYRYVK